jgi:hypothetical protein
VQARRLAAHDQTHWENLETNNIAGPAAVVVNLSIVKPKSKPRTRSSMRRDNVNPRISKRRRQRRKRLILKRPRTRAPINGLVFTPAEEPVWRKALDSDGVSAPVLLDDEKPFFSLHFPFP